jgi:hypothetical protein
MANEKVKKQEEENLVIHTPGGEMPDPNQRTAEQASEAGKAFEQQQESQKDQTQKKAG